MKGSKEKEALTIKAASFVTSQHRAPFPCLSLRLSSPPSLPACPRCAHAHAVRAHTCRARARVRGLTPCPCPPACLTPTVRPLPRPESSSPSPCPCLLCPPGTRRPVPVPHVLCTPPACTPACLPALPPLTLSSHSSLSHTSLSYLLLMNYGSKSGVWDIVHSKW